MKRWQAGKTWRAWLQGGHWVVGHGDHWFLYQENLSETDARLLAAKLNRLDQLAAAIYTD